MAALLDVPIQELGDRSLQVDEEPDPVNSTCVVFAKSEALSLLRQGWSVEKVLAAYCRAMVGRTVELLERIGIEREFAITGGQSKNIGLVKRLEKELGFEALKPGDLDPQIAGAMGAALFAKAFIQKSRKKAS